MKKWGCLLAITLFFAASGSPAKAGDWQPGQAQRMYYGLGLGMSLLNYNETNIINSFAAVNTTSSFNNDDFTFKLFGGYRFDPFLALEFGVSELGSTVATTSGSSTKLFDIYTAFVNATLTHSYNNKARLLGKIGTHFWRISTDSTNKLATGADLALGACLEFNLYDNSNRVIQVEWNRYMFDNIYLDASNSLMLSLVLKQ